MKKIIIVFFLIFLWVPVKAQDEFFIPNDEKKFKLRYELINDLVIIPVTLNGVELSFLLDTGVDHTILFSLKPEDSMKIKNTVPVFFRGLGKDKAIRALKSDGNSIKIGKSQNDNASIYIIFEHELSLSNRMGIPIHGIIGYDFFKDFIVKINYQNKIMKVYDPAQFNYRKCRSCEDLDIHLFNNKPYIQITAKMNDSITQDLNLLLDSGSGDALWLFQTSENTIKVPNKSFRDFLGYSLSGSVHGLRSRLAKLHIGNFKFSEITASFPDTSYIHGIDQYMHRDGSLGSKILKRFHIIIDYPNKSIRLKANKDIDAPFEYDMSGIVVAHSGYTFVKDTYVAPFKISTTMDDLQNTEHGYYYERKPQYSIVEIRENSPAQLSGLQIGDNVININGKAVYNYTLSDITEILSSKEGKKIKMKIERDGIEKIITFRLEKVL